MQHSRAEEPTGFSPALMSRAARWYYEDRLSQQEIADRLKTHRTTVSRLLQMARDRDIVRIQIVEPADLTVLSQDLAQRLGLRRVVVVDDMSTRGSSSVATAEHLVAPALAELAALGLKTGDVVGVSWGNAVRRVALAATEIEIDLTGVELVPVLGGMDESDPRFQTNEIVRQLGEHTHANVNFLHLPARLPRRLQADLIKHGGFGPRLAMWDRLTAALVGIGTTDPRTGTWPQLVEHKHTDLAAAVGDVAARYFTRTGAPVTLSDDDSIVGITRTQLKNTGCVLAVANGQPKVESIIGASRAELIDILVTDASTAEAVVESLDG